MITYTCPAGDCTTPAAWFPVLLFHRTADGRAADPPASLPLERAMRCTEHRRTATLEELARPLDRVVIEGTFRDAGRAAPDWASVEITWSEMP